MSRSRSPVGWRKPALAALLTTVLAGGLATSVPSQAGAAPAPDPVASAAGEGRALTVRPEPSYQQDEFEGWGTSLVWFANATGDYPDEIRERLADLVFGPDGLGLNIARYNIGGGNAPDVPDYLRPGGAVEGWWNAPAGTTREDTDWWSADDPADWNADADQTQRWWIDEIKDSITEWETFSNSPPWFMTESGYVSGGFDSSKDQLKTESIDDFVDYLVEVTERLEEAHGIQVDSIDPFNEPNTSYWGTQLGADGNPTGGRQEGAHIGPQLQQQVLRALSARMAGTDTDAVIAAMDETNPSTFVTNWMSYPQDVVDTVSRMNVHTYGTGQRTAVRDLSKSEARPLWMSEVEGNWGDRQSFTDMAPGLGMAQHITDDLRELEPSAWVFWQPVEDLANMSPGGESANGMNWGSIQMPFDCTAEDTLQTCPIRTNTKFDTIRNFTHYIRPGDHLIGVDDTSSVAALGQDGDTLTVVHTNEDTAEREVTLDLSAFATVANGATVTPVVSDETGALVEGEPVRVRDSSATVTVPARSVTTLVVSGVSGVEASQVPLQDGRDLRLVGVQSGRSLEVDGDGLQIGTTDTADAGQLFRLHKLDTGFSHRARYSLLTRDGRQVANVDGAAVLQPAAAEPEADAQWILSTTGDGTWTVVSAEGPGNLEVGGQSTADGSDVGVWQPNAADNQRWRITDETLTDVPRITLYTAPGVAPELPATVSGTTASGGTVALDATWPTLPASTWDTPGRTTVDGRATDPATGVRMHVRAAVTVDTVSATKRATARTYAGGTPALPATVSARTDQRHQLVTLPVAWQDADASFDRVGTVLVRGTATLPDGETVPAKVLVTVTEPVEANAVLDGATATADYSESGYPPSGLVDGVFTGKAWSNWQSGNQRGGGTVTVELAAARDVRRVLVHSYQDGTNVSYPRTARVEALVDGQWEAVSDTVSVTATGPAAPVVEIPVQPVNTDSVRVVMTADGFMTLSEIEVLALAAGD